jgi:hypothetical protein
MVKGLIKDLKASFEAVPKEEFLQFERVKAPFSFRRDLCAFIFLEKLAPSDRNIVFAAEHDEIWLDVDLEKLSAAATEDDILTLVRCGVRWDDDGLAMFV